MVRRIAGWARWVRFLLVWPAVAAYRRRANRSLRWRLAGYNLLTLVAGLATALILVGLLAAVGASARNYAEQEPAEDARVVAEFLVASGAIRPGEPPAEDGLRPVGALTSGDLKVFRDPRPDQFDTRPDRYLLGVQSVAVLMPELAADQLPRDAAAEEVYRNALAGETDLRRNSRLREFEGSEGVGAYPIIDSSGAQRGVVIVEKHDIQAPQGWAILRAQVRPVVTSVWVGSVVAALPGLAVAVVLAVAAARSVGGRIRNVSMAAESLAGGDRASRAPVSGEDEVATLALSFNSMAERLEDTMSNLQVERERALALLDANRQLVANVSHELRTPVAIIRGQVESLEEDDPENVRLQAALREISRLEQLVSDLFQLASAEAGSLGLRLEECDLGDLSREAAEPLADLAWRESHVRVVVVDPSAPVTARADPDRLGRVIQNLLRNAVRHTPEGGLVRVVVADQGGPAIVLSDTGPGIPAEDLPRVFDRFFRGDASRARDTGGGGLGLAIAREFVEAMGGTIEASSPPGEGATFTIRLPAREVSGEQPRSRPPNPDNE